jgi:hypothetical protein
MKHCPSCDFTFADFHHVCDFDGTELVPDPERPSLVKATPRLRRWLRSPLFLVGLLTVGLLSSGLLIGYYDSASQSASLVKDRDSQPSLSASALPAREMDQTPAQIKTPVASSHGKNAKIRAATLRPKTAASHSIARSYPRRPAGNRSAKSETEERAEADQVSQRTSVASPSVKPETSQREEPQQISRTTSYGTRSTKPVTAQRDPRASSPSQPISHDKESGFTAMLKTTWRVLKRPFKF